MPIRQDLLRPVSTALRETTDYHDCWGTQVQFECSDETQLALLGDTQMGLLDAFREAFYNLAAERVPNLADLGDLLHHSLGFRELGEELLQKNILPIFVGEEAANFSLFLQAAEREEQPQRLSLLSADATAWNELLQNAPFKIEQAALLGYQSYFLRPSSRKAWEERGQESWRLGEIRGQVNRLEPVLRDSDWLGIELSALRRSDCQVGRAASGLSIEEACQLLLYAGRSERLRGLCITGLTPDSQESDALLVAQLLWYFLEGYKGRKGEYPIKRRQLQGYKVELAEFGYILWFWKSERSQRWWVSFSEKEDSRLIPCSYADYQAATQGDLPRRLLLER